MQKRLCRRPEIFNDETIHYGIRSLCFCCHEMYTFIIIPPRTRSIVPLRQTTLDGKMYKVKKNNKRAQIQTQRRSADNAAPKDDKHTQHERLPRPARLREQYECLPLCERSGRSVPAEIRACNETFDANCICL